MTKRQLAALVAAGAGLVGLVAATGFAQADRFSGGHGWGHGGGWGWGHGRMMMEHFADRYDANKDRKITQEEIDTNRTATYGKFDADKDGNLSLAEFEKLWLEANRQRMVREFQRFDTDGDAKVTLDEYKKPLGNLVREADRNGDGALSRDDRPEPRSMMMRHGRPGNEPEQDTDPDQDQ
jgi:hypothetical protein